jgi:hypothetical protein
LVEEKTFEEVNWGKAMISGGINALFAGTGRQIDGLTKKISRASVITAQVILGGSASLIGIGLAGSIITNAGIGGVTDTVSQLASTGSFAELDPISIVTSTIMGGVAGWISGPGLKNASNPLAQADINISVLRQLNSKMPSQLYGDLISDTLSDIGQIAAREVGKQTGKFALGATAAGAVVTGVNIIMDFFRG